jgi:hypothetical protein
MLDHLQILLRKRLSPDYELRDLVCGRRNPVTNRREGGLIRDVIRRLPKSEARLRKARATMRWAA